MGNAQEGSSSCLLNNSRCHQPDDRDNSNYPDTFANLENGHEYKPMDHDKRYSTGTPNPLNNPNGLDDALQEGVDASSNAGGRNIETSRFSNQATPNHVFSDRSDAEPSHARDQNAELNDPPLFEQFSAPAVFNRVTNGPDARDLPSYGDLGHFPLPKPIDHNNPSFSQDNEWQRQTSEGSSQSGASLQTEGSFQSQMSFQTDGSLNITMQEMQLPSSAQKGKWPVRTEEEMQQSNNAEVKAREIDRQNVTINTLEGFGISFDSHDPLMGSDVDFMELDEEYYDHWEQDSPSGQESLSTDKFGFFESLGRYPEVCLAIARQLKVEDFINLFCISKDFHAAVNQHMTTSILDNVNNLCPESAKAFRFTMYDKLLTPDPTGRSHPTQPWMVRRVPGLRYLQMVHHREKMVRDILACLARQGHRTPEGMSNSLKKMWLLMDLSTTRQRVMFMHSRKYFTDMDLYNIQMFVVKLDMRFNDPIDGPGDDSVRTVMLGQRGLTPLRNLLRRDNLKSLEDIIKIQIRYDYQVHPAHMGLGIWGIPPAEIGIGHLEGWGQGLLHLMRPDELVVREAVRRGLDLKNHLMMMLLWGYVDPVTGENTSATEEEMYMSDETPVSMKYRWKEGFYEEHEDEDEDEDEDEEMGDDFPETPRQEAIDEFPGRRRAERQAEAERTTETKPAATRADPVFKDEVDREIDDVEEADDEEDEEYAGDAESSDDSYHTLSEYNFGEEANDDRSTGQDDTQDDPYSRDVQMYEDNLDTQMNDAIGDANTHASTASFQSQSTPTFGSMKSNADAVQYPTTCASASSSSRQEVPAFGNLLPKSLPLQYPSDLFKSRTHSTPLNNLPPSLPSHVPQQYTFLSEVPNVDHSSEHPPAASSMSQHLRLRTQPQNQSNTPLFANTAGITTRQTLGGGKSERQYQAHARFSTGSGDTCADVEFSGHRQTPSGLSNQHPPSGASFGSMNLSGRRGASVWGYNTTVEDNDSEEEL